jgi:hypothetical protein
MDIKQILVLRLSNQFDLLDDRYEVEFAVDKLTQRKQCKAMIAYVQPSLVMVANKDFEELIHHS